MAEFKMQTHVWLQLVCIALFVAILAEGARHSDEVSIERLAVAMVPFFAFAVYVFAVME